ncbi:hypothetical protein HKX48_007869 [Thoreauomyces humboldtii]|nr:hypothetical protein HKX48_007869 [Thoreauomyces humboldtii]
MSATIADRPPPNDDVLTTIEKDDDEDNDSNSDSDYEEEFSEPLYFSVHLTDLDSAAFACETEPSFVRERYSPNQVFWSPLLLDRRRREQHPSWYSDPASPQYHRLVAAYLAKPDLHKHPRSVYSLLFHIDLLLDLGTAIDEYGYEGPGRRQDLPPEEALDPVLSSCGWEPYNREGSWPETTTDFDLRDGRGTVHRFRISLQHPSNVCFLFSVRDIEGKLIAHARPRGQNHSMVECFDATLMANWAPIENLPDPESLVNLFNSDGRAAHGVGTGRTSSVDVLQEMRQNGHSDLEIATAMAVDRFQRLTVSKFKHNHQVELLFALACKCKPMDFGTPFHINEMPGDPGSRLRKSLQEALVQEMLRTIFKNN